MNKGTIYLIIFLLVISIVGTVVYVKFELPRIRGIKGDFSNVSISSKYNDNFIKNTLTIENGEKKEVETRLGYELIQLKKGVYQISNNNTDGFYGSSQEYNISEDTVRIDFKLTRPKEINLKRKDNGSLINVELSSENYQNVKICLKHTLSYIYVNVHLEKIDLLEGYEDWDKCYSLGKTIKGEEEINLSYSISGAITESDFIKLAIIDTDFINGEYRNQLNNQDLGGKDLIVNIK